MTREVLDKRIEKLKTGVLDLEDMVREACLGAVDALLKRDMLAARSIYLGDRVINAKRFELETECLVTIATQQPIARDLRVLASILDISTELERMGDYAKGIARVSIMIGDDPLPGLADGLSEMASIAVDMLDRAVKAFADEDEDLARAVPADDDRVDALFNKIYLELIQCMIDDPESIDCANHLQWALHNLERMADRVTNICERTLFVATGVMDELEETDDEFLGMM